MGVVQEVTGIIGVVGGAGGICWGVWTKVINPILRKEKRLKQDLHDKIDVIASKTDMIAKEMKMDGNGSLKTAIVKLEKTTERIEFRLDGIEEGQKVAMNLQGICYWISNDKGECIYASPTLCRLVQRTEHEILKNGWMTYIAEDDRASVYAAWEFSIKTQTAFDKIYHIKRTDGKLIKVWAVAFHKVRKNNCGDTLGKLTAIEEPI